MILKRTVLISIYASILQAYRPDGYIGCFEDRSDRILGGIYRYSETNTGDECIRYCAKYEYRYAGTENVKECFCGNFLSPSKPSYECNYRCGGDRSEICGGHWAVSVYYVTTVAKTATTTALTSTTSANRNNISRRITIHSTIQKEITSASNNSTNIPTSETIIDFSTQTIYASKLDKMHNSQLGVADKSNGTSVIVVPVILTLVVFAVIIVSVIVVKKRRQNNGDGVNNNYDEPTEKVSRKSKQPTDKYAKCHMSHISNNEKLENDEICVNNEEKVQSSGGFYDMLQHKSDSGSEYTTLNLPNVYANNINQDGLYEVLNEGSQPEALYSSIE